MASHRAAVSLVAAAVAIVVVASVPAARAVPTAATGVPIDANTIVAGAGAVERAALSFPVANSGDGGARWTAAQVPEAARVGDLAGGGGFGATLHGAVHFTATETASLPGARLTGASAAIATITASTLREWNIAVVVGLARAIVNGTQLSDRFHIFVMKQSLFKTATKDLSGVVYASTWNVNGTIMVVYVFRSGVLLHRARPVIEDLGIWGDRTKTDRSNSPLVSVTFEAP